MTGNIPITLVALHLGVVATETGLDPCPGLARPFLGRLGLTLFQGAIAGLYAATSPEMKLRREEYQGSYLGPVG